MIFNIISGFIIPWLLGIYLYTKDPRIIILIGPISSAIAFLVNRFGFYLNYWRVKPIELHEVSGTPYDLGIYIVMSCYMIYFIRLTNFHPYLVVLASSVIITFKEYIYLRIGRVFYYNGWNIYFTFLSYLVPHTLIYNYYKLLEKLNIF